MTTDLVKEAFSRWHRGDHDDVLIIEHDVMLAVDALVARLEAAEAVARAARRTLDAFEEGTGGLTIEPLRSALAAWERSQETGQP